MGSIQRRKSGDEFSLQVIISPYHRTSLDSLAVRTLAEEEPDVTSVAVRPGMVNTDVNIDLHFHLLF